MLPERVSRINKNNLLLGQHAMSIVTENNNSMIHARAEDNPGADHDNLDLEGLPSDISIDLSH